MLTRQEDTNQLVLLKTLCVQCWIMHELGKRHTRVVTHELYSSHETLGSLGKLQVTVLS